MGFLDEVSATLKSGTEAAQRSARILRLKSQIGDINKQRINLAAQLGASLYAETKDNAAFTQGRESLYAGIAECDANRAALQDEIAAIEREAAEVAKDPDVPEVLVCPDCGAAVSANDLLCSSCGKPVAEIKEQQEASSGAQGAEESPLKLVSIEVEFEADEDQADASAAGSAEETPAAQ